MSMIWSIIEQWAEREPERIALCDEQAQWTYRELVTRVRAMAATFQDTGVKRLALQLDNGLDWACCDLAGLAAGVVIIPVPLFFTAEQQAWVLESSGVDSLIGPGREGWSGHPLPQSKYTLWQRSVTSPTELPAGTAKITYTSGTTGQPKGVLLSDEHLALVSQSLAANMQSLDVTTHLTLLPFSTLLENITGLYVPLLLGLRSIVLPLASVGFTGSSQFNPAALVQTLLRWQPHTLVLVPELLRVVLLLVQQYPGIATSLQFIAVGGGKVAADLVVQARQLGLPVYEGYGLSECGSVVALNTPAHDRVGSVGQILPHCQITIAEDGEILVQGAAMLGYLGVETSLSSDEPIIATGDLGYCDAEGFLWISGRKKNVQITAFGRNFSPEWVEAEAQLFSAINKLVVFGDDLPNNVAVIQVNPSCAHLLSEQIQQLNARLPDYAQVHQMILADLSPGSGLSTMNGRLRRHAIFQQFHHEILQLTTGGSQ
jgi:Long-chain acyl-CoA synthetases (AMP-forming)